QSGDAFEQFIGLALEYVTWMNAEIRTQYPQLDLATFAAEHSYDDIRRKYPGNSVPPDGCLLIALDEGAACGCIALGRLEPTICEVRTLYVRPAGRGMHVGRTLVEAVLNQARGFGYHHARLDTLGFMESAQALYRSFGFYEIAPYGSGSASLRQYVRFLELKLKT
ncbi:MAG: GNAT family N-acetyltransferase, partial [Chloroflexota bacterium]